jgi:hypothetical protein
MTKKTLLFDTHQLIVLHFKLKDILVKTTVFDNYQYVPMFLINNWVKRCSRFNDHKIFGFVAASGTP